MHRRTVIAGAGTVALAGLAGCLGAVGLDEHEATPAGVDPATRDDTGYERAGIEERTVERDVAGVEEIVVRNYVTEHEKTIDMGPLGEQRGAVFMAMSTPKIGVPGQQFNPVEDMSAEELVETVVANYDGIGNVEHDDETDVTILDQGTTDTRFTGEAEFDGSSVDVYLHVTEAVETDDDLIVTIGVYPQDLQDREEPNVRDLMENVVPEADGTGDVSGSDEGDDTDGDDTDGDDEEDDGLI